MRVILNRDELRSRIHGCWMGKSIGGTLGAPFEGKTEVQDVNGYTTPVQGEPLPNDDLDLQLIWLKAVQENGARAITNRLLGEYWLNYIPPHWNEYGVCKANMRAGLEPPISGEYRNHWKHSNGAWIRSEIWACLAPGCPDIAIQYVYEDASVDHGGGEGTYAALFTAAVQSAAFVLQDKDELIRIGLSKIPPDCRVARSINIVLDAYQRGLSWREARELVVEDSADLGWFMAPANVAFVIIGWLYGEGDFGRSICIATNCGDDTDCTAATLGATLGIISGRSAIPAEWTEPIGERIVTVAVDRGSFQAPATLSDLTGQVMAQIPHSLAAFDAPVELSDGPTDLSGLVKPDLSDQTLARTIWSRSPFAVVYDFVHTRVTLDYGKAPDIRPGEPFPIKISLLNKMLDCRHAELIWHLPDGWSVLQGERNHVTQWIWDYKTSEIAVDLLPDGNVAGICRGILEILSQGRHTVGLVPLVFIGAGA